MPLSQIKGSSHLQTANKELNKYKMVLCRQLCFLDMFYAQAVDVIFFIATLVCHQNIDSCCHYLT